MKFAGLNWEGDSIINHNIIIIFTFLYTIFKGLPGSPYIWLQILCNTFSACFQCSCLFSMFLLVFNVPACFLMLNILLSGRTSFDVETRTSVRTVTKKHPSLYAQDQTEGTRNEVHQEHGLLIAASFSGLTYVLMAMQWRSVRSLNLSRSTYFSKML